MTSTVAPRINVEAEMPTIFHGSMPFMSSTRYRASATMAIYNGMRTGSLPDSR